ncbi:hypothetical protein R5R35_005069 [Gryllus longicercus]|uniref:C2H2-type domain-containing protein n=1 Tax=Gryllus longicercus TaxID=2509291 RepID=A0AAN9V6Z8_9ORTH
MTRDCLCSFRHCIHLTEMELLQFVENSNCFGNIASLGPQCIVCNCGSLSTYVDLGLMTSVTSQTETPLKEKIKNILNNKWVSGISETAFSLCLQCFHLVDQYDSLEAQMKIIHNEICNKYVNGHGIIHSVQTCEKPESQHCIASTVNGDRTKRTTSSKRTSGSKRKKASLDNIPTLHAQIVQLEPEAKRDAADAPALLQWQATPVAVFEAAGAGAGAMGPGAEPALPPPPPPLLVTGLPVAWPGDATAADACPGLRILTLENPPAAPPPPLPLALPAPGEEESAVAQLAAEQAVDDPGLPDDDDDAFIALPQPLPAAPPPQPATQPPPLAVYDEGDACAAGLRAGERVRVGTALGEGEGQGLACSYCAAAAFPDAAALRQHARLVHRPRVLSAALPPHLGLGARANCGVELSAVQPRPGAAHARPFVCIACDGAFKFKSNLQLHFKDKHSPHTPFACADCRAAFRRPIELSRHRVYYCPLRKRAPDPAPPARKR